MKVSKLSEGKKTFLPMCPAEKPEGESDDSPCGMCGGARGKREECYIGGDTRTNDGVSLITFHTLFVREHNRLAEKLAELNPTWDDERLFQKARKINIAQYQHIVYKEFLPLLIGMSTIQ